MASDKKDTDAEFLARFERLSEQVPVDDAEADELLREAGVDADASLGRLMAKVEEQEKRQKEERYARAAAKRAEALKRLQQPPVKRSRTEMLARIRQLQPDTVAFKGFESAPDEDLETLLAQLEEMASRGKKE